MSGVDANTFCQQEAHTGSAGLAISRTRRTGLVTAGPRHREKAHRAHEHIETSKKTKTKKQNKTTKHTEQSKQTKEKKQNKPSKQTEETMKKSLVSTPARGFKGNY